jgi:type IV secretory pathway VirB10-like protein
MSVGLKNDESKEGKAIEDIGKEKKAKGISIKTIFMILMIIAIILLLLTRAIFSLKDSISPKTNKANANEDNVLVVDEGFNIAKTVGGKKPIDQDVNHNSDENVYYEDDQEQQQQDKVIIFKGKLGLAQAQNEQKNNSSNETNTNTNTNSDSDNVAKNNIAVKAEVLKLDPNLSIRRGTFIKCSLRTDLISQVSGGIGCIINDDVYSTNGHVLLIEKGSIVNGAFRRAGVNHGDSRIFVLWEEIITPHDITINVNSGASDVLGGQGIDGWVDEHFWTRFGNAILVSLITDASSSASSRLQKENTSNDFSNTTESGAHVAKTIIEKSVDIPPTIYRNHGDSVGIYINQNIDFSDVYKLEYKK